MKKRTRKSGNRQEQIVELNNLTFLVMQKRCDQCLFSAAKIVSDKRRDQIIADCLKDGTHFVCHKPALLEMKGEYEGNTNVCCRGFYDAYPGQTVIRFAAHLGLIHFVQPQEDADESKEG